MIRCCWAPQETWPLSEPPPKHQSLLGIHHALGLKNRFNQLPTTSPECNHSICKKHTQNIPNYLQVWHWPEGALLDTNYRRVFQLLLWVFFNFLLFFCFVFLICMDLNLKLLEVTPLASWPSVPKPSQPNGFKEGKGGGCIYSVADQAFCVLCLI